VWRTVVGALAIGIAVAVFLAGVVLVMSDDGTVTERDGTGADTVVGSVEVLDGRTYHCFRYTKVDRGGLWCQEIGR